MRGFAPSAVQPCKDLNRLEFFLSCFVNGEELQESPTPKGIPNPQCSVSFCTSGTFAPRENGA